MESLDQCPVCGNTEFKTALKCPDHFLTREIFQIQSCTNCKLLITNPRPDVKNSVKYYKSDSYVSHSNSSATIFNRIYKTVRNITLKRKLKMIERFSFKGNLLDYGCGTGHFISLARQKGWQVHGVEPDDTARTHLSKDIANQVVPDYAMLPADQKFNVITLFHVLEHVHALDETLRALLDKLDKNGVLFLALPNHLSDDAHRYAEYWAGYDVPRHLYHFNQRSVFQLSKKYGLNIVSTIPMVFDSYYVSMLSEKYQGNKFSFLRGLLNGYRSNRKAKKTKEYSSLIYVLTK